MTQEQKQLLIKDLCSRLPYETWVEYEGKEWLVTGYGHGRVSLLPSVFSSVGGPCPLVEEIRLYLRPMSSMTEEEKAFLGATKEIEYTQTGLTGEGILTLESYDYLNSIHVDYRGLIPMGLALEATEGMYK